MAWRRLANFLTGRNPASERAQQRAADIGLAWLLTTQHRRRVNIAENSENHASIDEQALVEELGRLSVDQRAAAVQENVNLQVVRCFRALERCETSVHEAAVAEGHRRRLAAQASAATDRFESVLPGTRAPAQARPAELHQEAVAAAMREEFGFSTRVGPSTIDGAGLGLFVDGTAPGGALLGLFPGLVHLPENLKDKVYYREVMESDRNFMLLARYDWHVIDCRLLETVPRSIWALAHMANHPPPLANAANSMYMAYDFPGRKGRVNDPPAGDVLPEGLRRWVPNQYAIKPAIFGGKVDRSMLVEGAALLATRELRDEEVFLDYRLNPELADKLPSWYVPADAAAARRRWVDDGRGGA